MHPFLNSPWQIGSLQLPNRLIQGPLAGYSCAPFRQLYGRFLPPAYCVAEMCSAIDVLNKHTVHSRYLYRAPNEHRLAYQLSGTDPQIMAEAAAYLASIGGDIIDINCGCPKSKIRKKGAGSALLEQPKQLAHIIQAIKNVISIPLTVKIRLQDSATTLTVAQMIADAGADALIVHGRTWQDDYDVACDFKHIAAIKQQVTIPVIANGDIHDSATLQQAITQTGCDAYMIARAGSGKPWLYQELLSLQPVLVTKEEKINLFIDHLSGLAALENDYKALLQSKSLIRYYFRNQLSEEQLKAFYTLSNITAISNFLINNLVAID